MALAASRSRRGSGSGRKLNRAIDSVLRLCFGASGYTVGISAGCKKKSPRFGNCERYNTAAPYTGRGPKLSKADNLANFDNL